MQLSCVFEKKKTSVVDIDVSAETEKNLMVNPVHSCLAWPSELPLSPYLDQRLLTPL
jgi:hypothetical protein